MNKDNENVSNQFDEEVDLNGSTETVDEENDNQLVSESDSENNSDCSNNESIGEGDFPNTFVQSEEIIVEEFSQETIEDSDSDESENNEIVDEQLNKIKNENVQESDLNTSNIDKITINNQPGTGTETLNQKTDNILNDENGTIESDSRLSVNQNKSKINKKQLVIIFALILAIGAMFIMIKKPFSAQSEKQNSSASLNQTDEKLVEKSFDKILNYYENGKNGKVLKADVDLSSLDDLKKDIDKISNDTARQELQSQFYQLQQDIKNRNSQQISSSSVVSYNVTFNKA